MVAKVTKPGLDDRFAVYLGDGLYLSAYGRYTTDNSENYCNGSKRADAVVHTTTGHLSDALAESRPLAVAALHAARRAGLRAWLVQHPFCARAPASMAGRGLGALQ